MSMYNLKDMARINIEVGEQGMFRNKSSLDFTIDFTTRNKLSWLTELSHIVRSVIVDHPFMDGNKRTALLTCLSYFQEHNYNLTDTNKKQLTKLIHTIASQNITNITKIERALKKCITKQK